MRQQCSTPKCENMIFVSAVNQEREHAFCTACRRDYSSSVLQVQAAHGQTIKEILVDAASIFNTASSIGDYIGVSFVTVYNWIDVYFGMSFAEFKRQYICQSSRCRKVSVKLTKGEYDYLAKKIKASRYCACTNSIRGGDIMTSAPTAVLESILERSGKTITKKEDEVTHVFFKPTPVHYRVTPLYYNGVT